MSRNLLILVLVVSGTGCSATRPLWSTIVVTPPRIAYRSVSRGESCEWTSVAVTYPSDSLAPAPCTPSPVRSAELVASLDEEMRSSLQSSIDPAPAVTTIESELPAIVQLDQVNHPPPALLQVPNGTSVSTEFTPLIQTAVSVTYPSGSMAPAPCKPSPVRTVVQATSIEGDVDLAPPSPGGLALTLITEGSVSPTIVQVASTDIPQSINPVAPSLLSASAEVTPRVEATSTRPPLAPLVPAESPPSTESLWKPVTSAAPVSSVQSHTAIRCNQNETPSPDSRQAVPDESPISPVATQPDLTDLLTEIRNQRQLIEALQRDLTRERSADDAAIDELEAAVEDLLVQAKTSPRELPSVMPK